MRLSKHAEIPYSEAELSHSLTWPSRLTYTNSSCLYLDALNPNSKTLLFPNLSEKFFYRKFLTNHAPL